LEDEPRNFVTPFAFLRGRQIKLFPAFRAHVRGVVLLAEFRIGSVIPLTFIIFQPKEITDTLPTFISFR